MKHVNIDRFMEKIGNVCSGDTEDIEYLIYNDIEVWLIVEDKMEFYHGVGDILCSLVINLGRRLMANRVKEINDVLGMYN